MTTSPLTGIAVIGIPLLIYIAGALSVRRRDVQHPDDFFIAYRKVGVTAFSSSSIAYAFQVSTIYPFLLWGGSSFYFVPVINTLCWGLGILLFLLCFDRYKAFIGQDNTLHGFLGDRYGNSTRITASWLTILGFIGFAVAETYFGSRIVLAVVDSKPIFYGIIFAALLLVYGYVAYGGQVSSVRTDQLQLIFSYAGVFGVIIYLLFLQISSGATTPGALGIGLGVLAIYIPTILVIRKGHFIKLSETDSKSHRLINRALNVAVSLILVTVSLLAIFRLLQSDIKGMPDKFANLEGFGIPGLLSLIILPLGWQFVDLTNWQRLLAVKPPDGSDTGRFHGSIRKGLLIYAIESPFTWALFLFFGLLAVSALPSFSIEDLLVDIPRQLIASEQLLPQFMGFVFIMSVCAIMLSTIDSFLVGIMFTFAYDSWPRSRRILDTKDDSKIRASYRRIVNGARLFGLGAILVGAFLVVFFDRHVPKGGELFINLLLAFYSAQLSFLPLVFGILFLKRQPNRYWANGSMIAGATAGISLGIYAVLGDTSYAWYPVLVCTGLSSIVYLIGWLLTDPNDSATSAIAKSVVHHVSNNKVSVAMFVLFCALAFTQFCGLSQREPWRDWETCALLFTLFYTMYIYGVNWRRFRKVLGKPAMILGAAPLTLAVVTAFSANSDLHWLNFVIDREEIMFFLVGTALVFVIIDFVLYRALRKTEARVSNAFKLSLKFSDVPVLIAFLVLAVYAVKVGPKAIEDLHMDAFFGGAIAFQMMLSNLIWTFTDDPLIEENSLKTSPSE